MNVDGIRIHTKMKLCYHCMHQVSGDKARFCDVCGKELSDEPQSDRFLRPGTLLYGKYIIGHPLGAGGFGNTYIGWDNFLNRKIAVKEFYPKQYCRRGQEGETITVTDTALQPRFQRGLRQFLAEARSVAALQDVQGIVKISNFFEANKTGYIVMEYLEGMDVKTILEKSENRKDYEWCRRVILTVLYTLREIHKRGVLHRDIAPDNIFVTNEGIIKLIDFGAAKYASVSEQSGDIMLKAGYSPIEQYGRKFEQGPYTDLYAVAALFYRMLTGQKPIPANMRLEQDALIAPSEMGILIPKQAEMAIMVCLNVIPEYRLQSAEDFMEALDGKDFVPVYEPEWILPPVEEKRGVKKKIASLPIPAKVGLCIVAICAIVGAGVGTVALIRSRTERAATLDSREVVMPDLTGMTAEEADASVASLNRHGWNVRLETEDSVFDLTKENGTVCSQSVAPGTALYDPSKETAGEESTPEGLSAGDDGTVSGIIYITLYSNEKLYYRDLSGQNAYELAQKLGVDPADKDCFIAEEGDGGELYFDLKELEIGGRTISAIDLERKSDQNREITYRSDIKIHYFATDFFYWKKLPDFAKEYEMIDDVPEQEVFRYVNENKRQSVGKKTLEDGRLVDDSYCAFASDGYEEGQIVGQTVAAGEAYDGSNPGDTPLEIQVVGMVLDYADKTGSEFTSELEKEGFGYYTVIQPNGSAGNLDWSISEVVAVKAWKDENGDLLHDDNQTLKIFRPDTPEGPSVCFIIYVKEPETEPQPDYTGAGSTGGGEKQRGEQVGLGILY